MNKAKLLIFVMLLSFALTGCATENKQGIAAPTINPLAVTTTPSATASHEPTKVPEAITTPSPSATPAAQHKESPTAAPTKPMESKKVETSSIAAPKQVERKAEVKIISVTSPAARNSTATLKANVAPNATASIVVRYKSGASKAAGLESKKADANGNVSWSWHVGGNTTLGSWPITVTCDGESADTEFEVVH